METETETGIGIWTGMKGLVAWPGYLGRVEFGLEDGWLLVALLVMMVYMDAKREMVPRGKMGFNYLESEHSLLWGISSIPASEAKRIMPSDWDAYLELFGRENKQLEDTSHLLCVRALPGKSLETGQSVMAVPCRCGHQVPMHKCYPPMEPAGCSGLASPLRCIAV